MPGVDVAPFCCSIRSTFWQRGAETRKISLRDRIASGVVAILIICRLRVATTRRESETTRQLLHKLADDWITGYSWRKRIKKKIIFRKEQQQLWLAANRLWLWYFGRVTMNRYRLWLLNLNVYFLFLLFTSTTHWACGFWLSHVGGGSTTHDGTIQNVNSHHHQDDRLGKFIYLNIFFFSSSFPLFEVSVWKFDCISRDYLEMRQLSLLPIKVINRLDGLNSDCTVTLNNIE